MYAIRSYYGIGCKSLPLHSTGVPAGGNEDLLHEVKMVVDKIIVSKKLSLIFCFI